MGTLVFVAVCLAAVLLTLGTAAWSCVKSSSERGRRKGLALAVDEMLHGAQPHLGSRDAAIPKSVLKALAQYRRTIVHSGVPCEPALWELGNAVGDACWRNGHDEGVMLGAIPDGMIRLDVSLADLLQMSWLAHLGFQHMMPNYRGFELHRFSGPEDASEGARSVAILECALPRSERPFADIRAQIAGREKLIADWWPVIPERRLA